jgi:hypothetical protein
MRMVIYNEKLCETCKKPLTEEQKKRDEAKYCSSQCWANRKRDFAYDTDFLENQTDFSGYFIGLFVADGHRDKKYGGIHISSIDKQMIDDIVKLTNYKKKMYERIDPKRPNIEYSISYFGPISKAIAKMGYPKGAKTGKEFIPKFINENIFNAFLRGFIDGDGTFHVEKDYGYLLCSMVNASKKLLEDIFFYLKLKRIVKSGSLYKKKNNLYILKFGHEDSVVIGDYIYKNATIKLNRKYEKYLKGKEYQQQVESQRGKICSVEECNVEAFAKGLCKVHYDKQFRQDHPLTKEQIDYKNELRRKAYQENSEKYREYANIWRKENPEKVKEIKQKYNQNNREKINEYKKEYRRKNIEKHKEMDRKKYLKRKDAALKQMKKHYNENRDKKLAYAEEYRNKNREEIRRKQREAYRRKKQSSKEKLA